MLAMGKALAVSDELKDAMKSLSLMGQALAVSNELLDKSINLLNGYAIQLSNQEERLRGVHQDEDEDMVAYYDDYYKSATSKEIEGILVYDKFGDKTGVRSLSLMADLFPPLTQAYKRELLDYAIGLRKKQQEKVVEQRTKASRSRPSYKKKAVANTKPIKRGKSPGVLGSLKQYEPGTLDCASDVESKSEDDLPLDYFDNKDR